jgi:hypothetical protein
MLSVSGLTHLFQTLIVGSVAIGMQIKALNFRWI